MTHRCDEAKQRTFPPCFYRPVTEERTPVRRSQVKLSAAAMSLTTVYGWSGVPWTEACLPRRQPSLRPLSTGIGHISRMKTNTMRAVSQRLRLKVHCNVQHNLPRFAWLHLHRCLGQKPTLTFRHTLSWSRVKSRHQLAVYHNMHSIKHICHTWTASCPPSLRM